MVAETPLTLRLVEAMAAEERDGRPGKPVSVYEAERPTTLAEAETLQDALLRELGWPAAAAWKLVGTTHAGIKALGLGGFFSGFNPPDRLLTTPARLSRRALRQAIAEGELAFRFAMDLPPRSTGYSQDEVLAAIGSAHPAIEIPQSRFQRLGSEGGFALAADNGAAGWSIVGPGTEVAGLDLAGAFEVELKINGETVARGDAYVLAKPPLALVTDHVNRIGRRGWGTKAGEFVLTGSLNPPHDFASALGEGEPTIVADFGAFGDARLTIEP